MIEAPYGHRQHWKRKKYSRQPDPIHILHVLTDEGIEGMCTVGGARYTPIRARDIEHLRTLTPGKDPLQRECLDSKLRAVMRHIFTLPGFHGVFENYLRDIAGKAAQLTICDLIGRARPTWPVCYNFDSSRVKSALEDANKTVGMGSTALKNHWISTAEQNIFNARSIRQTFIDIPLPHDAASASYKYEEALFVGRALQDLRFEWFEEPIPDRNFEQLQALRSALYISILAPETLTHEWELSALWLRQGAIDLLRANARQVTTATLKLVHCARMQDSTIELNGPGGTRNDLSREICLMNSPLPTNGCVCPPRIPVWGAEWDRAYFEKTRIALL